MKRAHKGATPKPTLTPKLRFPEFRDAPGWSVNTLSGACRMQAGQFVAASKIREQPTTGSFPCYGGNGLRGYTETFTHEGTYPLIGRQGALCGNVKLGKGKFHATEHAVAATPKQGIDIVWLYYVLNFLRLNQYATGQAQPGLSVDVLEKIPIAIPEQNAEQNKIADCLSSLDELIGAESQKLTALKAHKKGIMQQLFPREGETVPRLRFPEFRDAGEWEECNISTFAKVTTGGRDTQNKADCGLYPFFVRSQTVERIDTYSHNGEAILTSGDGVGVGKNYHYINGKFDFHQRVYCIYDFAESVSGLFFYLYFSEHFGERVMRMSAKNSVDSVRMAMITEMPILLPSLDEQKHIASCLSSLDNLIAAQSDKLDALKTHKKGLMQQLFPAPEEAKV